MTRVTMTSLTLALVALLPRTAEAQTVEDPPRVSIGAGGGFANLANSDFTFTPSAWDADVRLAFSRHGMIEIAFSQWRHSSSSVRQNLPTTPGGGTIGRLEEQTTHKNEMVQFNVLFRSAGNRARFYGGGGVGSMRYSRQFTQITSECTPPATCGTFENPFSSTSGIAQGVGGVEVRIFSGLTAFGQLRLTIPFRDVAMGDTRVTAGVRWGFGTVR